MVEVGQVEDLQVEAGDAGPLPPRPEQVVDQLGTCRERTDITRFYLQILDLADLDHVELIAAEVAPQLG